MHSKFLMETTWSCTQNVIRTTVGDHVLIFGKDLSMIKNAGCCLSWTSFLGHQHIFCVPNTFVLSMWRHKVCHSLLTTIENDFFGIKVLYKNQVFKKLKCGANLIWKKSFLLLFHSPQFKSNLNSHKLSHSNHNKHKMVSNNKITFFVRNFIRCNVQHPSSISKQHQQAALASSISKQNIFARISKQCLISTS